MLLYFWDSDLPKIFFLGIGDLKSCLALKHTIYVGVEARDLHIDKAHTALNMFRFAVGLESDPPFLS